MKTRTISDIVSKTTLNQQDLETLADIFQTQNKSQSDSLVVKYLDALLADAATFRRRVVEDNPELAIRLFSIFHDVAIGQYFVKRYNASKGYGAAAADIAKSLQSGKGKRISDSPPFPQSID